MAAANPARGTNKYETRLSPELMNRFKHYNVQPDFDSFRAWGLSNRLHPLVLGYLAFDQSKLYAEKETEETAFPTPRSWKSVSDLITAYEDADIAIDALHYEISSDIGTGAALEFCGWCKISDQLPDVDLIIQGEESDIPRSPDVLHAIVASVTASIRQHSEDISISELENVFEYILSFPSDFIALFVKNLRDIEGLNLKLMKVAAYKDWCDDEV